VREHGDYALTTKLPALGLSYLGGAGIIDIAQPIIDRLADISGELVRMALVDGDRLTFVGKAQGARSGLRYDPDMGIDVRLSCSAGGHAWLMTLSEERATELVARQGFGSPKEFGPKAPTTFKALRGRPSSSASAARASPSGAWARVSRMRSARSTGPPPDAVCVFVM